LACDLSGGKSATPTTPPTATPTPTAILPTATPTTALTATAAPPPTPIPIPPDADEKGYQLLEIIDVEAANNGVIAWPSGEFRFPVDIAVTGDGHYVFIGDGFDEFAFLTAYRYP